MAVNYYHMNSLPTRLGVKAPKELQRCHFFQALRLLEQQENMAAIQFQPSSSYAFPSSDISEVTQTDSGVTFSLSFMGLYGVDSPLPGFFHDLINRDTLSAQRIMALLNIINHRIYELLYEAWKAYRPDVSMGLSSDSFATMCQGISGFNLSTGECFAATSIYARKKRTQSGLKCLLELSLKAFTVHIKRFVPEWLVVTHQPLGRGTLQLAGNSLLGSRILDYSSAIDVCLESVVAVNTTAFLKENLAKIKRIIFGYLGADMHVRIMLTVVNGRHSPLGVPCLALGRSTWLGCAKRSHELVVYSSVTQH